MAKQTQIGKNISVLILTRRWSFLILIHLPERLMKLTEKGKEPSDSEVKFSDLARCPCNVVKAMVCLPNLYKIMVKL